MLPANAAIGFARSKQMTTTAQTASASNLLPLDGKLSKYTNVMKGWQNRYFLLNPQQGILEYHVNQAEAFGHSHRPRGSLQLAGAVISPSIDDSFTFSVNAANGEFYKLRAHNAKERQHWVSHIRAVANHFTLQIAEDHPPIAGQVTSSRKPRSLSASVTNIGNKIKVAADQVQQKTKHKSGEKANSQTSNHSSTSVDAKSDNSKGTSRVRANSRTSLTKSYGNYNNSPFPGKRGKKSECRELRDVKEVLNSADHYHAGLLNMFAQLPRNKSSYMDSEESQEKDLEIRPLSSLDDEVLMLKSTTAATLKILSECYGILQQQKSRQMPGIPAGAQITWVEPQDSVHSSSPVEEFIPEMSRKFDHDTSVDSMAEELMPQDPNVNPSDELCDSSEREESDIGAVENHKSIIMHLLSQLKLGMDLTRVTLPTFILEKRSLLEMYANFLAHPDLFISIPDGKTPQDRMIRVLKYYLTAFHCGRKDQVAKKPYNPIIGEVFQCSYYVSKSSESTDDGNDDSTAAPSTETHHRIKYVSEQVSHHPPVSAFYADCPEREICINAHIWTKSKFMNMSIGVVNIGEGEITLTGHKERYVVTFPSAFARSILTTPWMELGGRCTITCDQTNMAASVVFHTKPVYGGHPHRITSEVKDLSTGSVFCRVEGEWNGDLNFTTTTNEGRQKTEQIVTRTFKGHRKYVRPLSLQTPMESRNLWNNVTEALMQEDISTATKHKSTLENCQRTKEKRRKDSGRPVETILFHKNGDSYLYSSSIADHE